LDKGGIPNETDHDGHGGAVLGRSFAGDGANDIDVGTDIELNVKTNFETNAQTHHEHNCQ
jgi:hypothetical protein